MNRDFDSDLGKVLVATFLICGLFLLAIGWHSSKDSQVSYQQIYDQKKQEYSKQDAQLKITECDNAVARLVRYESWHADGTISFVTDADYQSRHDKLEARTIKICDQAHGKR